MNKIFRIPGVWLPLFLLTAAALFPADVVTLKDGRVLEGRVIEEGEETVVFQIEGREPVNIHPGLVASIEYAEGRPRHPDEAEELEFLAGKNYLSRVSEALKSAERSIKVMMYLAYNSGHTRCPGNILMTELARARRRGVEVKVILEGSHVKMVNDANLNSAEWLLERGIEARIFPVFPVMHTKLVLIDDEIVVVGSHNWTAAAIHLNNESSVLVRCRRTARRLRVYFDRAEQRARPYGEMKQQVGKDG